MKAAARKRPCRICRRWFLPAPRAGNRQYACSSPDCQRERHRRSCARWRSAERDAEHEHTLAQRLRAPVAELIALSAPAPTHVAVHAPPGESPAPAPSSKRAATTGARQLRDAVGMELCVVLRIFAEHLLRLPRDAVATQPAVHTAKLAEHARQLARDAIGAMAAGP